MHSSHEHNSCRSWRGGGGVDFGSFQGITVFVLGLSTMATLVLILSSMPDTVNGIELGTNGLLNIFTWSMDDGKWRWTTRTKMLMNKVRDLVTAGSYTRERSICRSPWANINIWINKLLLIRSKVKWPRSKIPKERPESRTETEMSVIFLPRGGINVFLGSVFCVLFGHHEINLERDICTSRTT